MVTRASVCAVAERAPRLMTSAGTNSAGLSLTAVVPHSARAFFSKKRIRGEQARAAAERAARRGRGTQRSRNRLRAHGRERGAARQRAHGLIEKCHFVSDTSGVLGDRRRAVPGKW